MKFTKILLLIALSCAIVSVSVADVKASASTTGIEKGPAIVCGGHSYDAIIELPQIGYLDIMYVPDLRLALIHWVADQWFYEFGYQAKLSDAIDEIIAPPDLC